VLDGIALEKRGIPSAVICTEAFTVTGKAIAAAHNAADYPFIIVKHPIASATDEELTEQARRVTPQVASMLQFGKF
jgi:hypothetical protein